MKLVFNSAVVSVSFAANIVAPLAVEGHGYLKTPRSRNYHASINPKWWGGTETDPAPENCPHCLNIGGTEARCGLVGDHNYDYPPNAIGGVLDPVIQGCYEPGSIIELETILTAHHKGHFVYKACAISPGEVPTQECFDSNPLTFVADDLYGANPDPNYPERAYIPNKEFPVQFESGGNALFRHKYQLPLGLSGDLVLIQWHYITGNSCVDVGYDKYNWPEEGFQFQPGVTAGSISQCAVIPPDGRGVPEQFWNCAEVKISTTCGVGGPIVGNPTSQPTPNPTKAPTTNITVTTTSSTINTGATMTTTVPGPDRFVLNSNPRCGASELDAREHCRPTCISDSECNAGEWCWGVHENYCGSIPQRLYEEPLKSPVVSRCGVNEAMARTFCGAPCSSQLECTNLGESCIPVHSNYCDSVYIEVGATTTEATSTTTVARSSTINTAATVTAISSTTSSGNYSSTTTQAATTIAPPPTTCPNHSAVCGPGNPCGNGMCCSQWGYCGTTEAYCGSCCQSNCGSNEPPTTPATVSATPKPSPSIGNPPTSSPPEPAVAGKDSRIIAYLGNWQSCPTPEQVDAYTHIVVAFATSYVWSSTKNSCDAQCSIDTSVPVCNNQINQELVDSWRAQGKKVILSFGGAGMGGSWSGDQNNCWDYCYGREEAISDALIDVVQNQNFDGVDIDYEYCYDVSGTQSGRCSQRDFTLYSDTKAQTFLSTLTSLLRQKLDSLGSGYELTHAPMDSDLVPSSKYYQILKEQNANLDYLMPQFYNGITRPAVDGVLNGNQGRISTVSMFDDLANDLFPGQPSKVRCFWYEGSFGISLCKSFHELISRKICFDQLF
ncbi:hypothetical protein ACHAXS_006500 [Conticribra weissflogii]